MRSSILLCLIPAALCAATSPSPANVTISNASTVNMACSGGVCSPTAADAVLNVLDLEAMLASGNATVTTTGSGVQAVNIHVNARLTWSTGATLALDAFRSIKLDSVVKVAGTGGVSLTTNDGGSGGEFACNDNGAVTFTNMSGKLTVNGTAYTLVNNIASLATAIAANPSGAYALATNYNAKKDGTYTSSPIATVFSGSFNGLGNTISNLSIKDLSEGDFAGLFAETSGGTICNIRLTRENVLGGRVVGGLVGDAYGAIAHSFTSGTVSGPVAGGLLGESGIGVTGSGSTAAVSGSAMAGGLIGIGQGPISDSWATGNVSGDADYIGGLVGYTYDSDIRHSWASGQVSTIVTWATAGGLVGFDYNGSIVRSYATGAVACKWACGGLVGEALDGGFVVKISQSYATGTVTNLSTNGSAGGLVGSSESCSQCEIVNSYASGAVSGGWGAGGLVGKNEPPPHGLHSISSSYATGAVNGTSLVGGLIGYDFTLGVGIKRTYWDKTTSGISDPSQGAGNVANDPGIKGLSDSKLKSGLPKGFDPAIWAEDANINNGFPYLIANPPPK